MRIQGKEYRTIWYEEKVVKIIDQTKLPHQFTIKDLNSVKDVINAIKVMEVRGAPLIGGTAAYGIVLAIQESAEKAKIMIKNLIDNFEDYIDPKDPTNNCLDVAIITTPEKRTQKTIDKLKTVAGRVLSK